MKLVLLTLGLSIFGRTSSLVSDVDSSSLAIRALPNAPNGYTPTFVDCPADRPSARSAASLSPQESTWLKTRRKNTVPAMQNLLKKINIPNFNVNQYFSTHGNNESALPNIGIGVSGGGWRALQCGAGALQAFDSRSNPGKLGGLLQSSTYLAGLSGGAWLVGSLFMNNFSTITAIRGAPTGDLWQFDTSVIEGPKADHLQTISTLKYLGDLLDDVGDKDNAGFETTITDIWGRALSYQLINADDGGPAYTWSSIAASADFQNGNTPFPLVIADTRDPGAKAIPSNTTIYEFNAYEFGSWDPTVFGFIPMKYLGTNFTAGKVSSGAKCVVGFDNAGYVMGTSSSLFNQIILNFKVSDLPSIATKLLLKLLNKVDADNEDIAEYKPNPFYQYNPSTNPSGNSDTLHLVDGGEDNQNIPFHPLIQPARDVDIIFAIDSSADTTHNWPNGSALVNTYERNLASVSISNGTRFPSIPDTNTFINLGLNTRPTFFGCNANNFSATDNTNPHTPPLIVYIPNYPYVTYSNVSTLTLTYNDTFRDAIILNGYDFATMGNASVDHTWPTCAGCAIMSRSWWRTGTKVPSSCEDCFKRFCWDGTVNSTTPKDYDPKLLLQPVDLGGNDLAAQPQKNSGTALKVRRWW